MQRALRAIAIVFGAGVGGTAGALLGSVIFVRALSRRHLVDLDHAPAVPVGLVLGAQVYPSGRPSPFLAARLDLAVELYRRGLIRVVLVSGDHRAIEYDEPAAMRRYLIARGVPEERVVGDGGGLDTYASCVRAGRMFGVRRLIVLTQSYHLPRAVATARAVGLDAVGIGDDSVRSGSRSWRRGAVRDQLATVKTVLDLVSRRDPTDGARSDAVLRALERQE